MLAAESVRPPPITPAPLGIVPAAEITLGVLAAGALGVVDALGAGGMLGLGAVAILGILELLGALGAENEGLEMVATLGKRGTAL